MNNYRYTLETYKGPSSRYTCPQCRLKRVFVRYIDTQTGLHLGDDIGRCNREINCGYHGKPRFENSRSQYLNANIRQQASSIKQPASSIQQSVFNESLDDYSNNHLVRYLNSVLGAEVADEVVRSYHVGTHHHWDCSTVFWQVDEHNVIRTGKVMLYDPVTGKRIRQPHNHITWVHSLLHKDDYHLQQCFFGQHLLRSNGMKPVAIVESEKTALIASAHMPQYIWMATGSLSNLTAAKCKALGAHNIMLYPDLGAEDRWAKLSASIPNCKVYNWLPDATAEQIAAGWDIADYLMMRT